MVSEVRPDKKIITWDTAPGQDYFDELFRVSRNQIIWGGELFQTPANTMLSCVAENKHSRIVHDGNG